MNNYDLTEASGRVDLEAAQLLKQAGFNEPTEFFFAHPENKLYVILDAHDNVSKRSNDQFGIACSAPLIPIVLLWLEGLGYERAIYEHSCMNYYHNGKVIDSIDMNDINEFSEHQRQQDLAYIKSCCNHIINQQKY